MLKFEIKSIVEAINLVVNSDCPFEIKMGQLDYYERKLKTCESPIDDLPQVLEDARTEVRTTEMKKGAA